MAGGRQLFGRWDVDPVYRDDMPAFAQHQLPQLREDLAIALEIMPKSVRGFISMAAP
jgi:hypothetical protein